MVAPDGEQAVEATPYLYQGIYYEPYKIDDFSGRAYCISGTPADCTRVGLVHLMKDPDLVISGVNMGYNAGTDTLYSGTVSAAVEARIYGFPAIAVSTEHEKTINDADFKRAVEETVRLIDRIGEKIVEEKLLLNFNLPYRILHDEIISCPVGDSLFYQYDHKNEEDKDLLIAQVRQKRELTPNTDRYYLNQGYMTLSPMQFNLTKTDQLDVLSEILR